MCISQRLSGAGLSRHPREVARPLATTGGRLGAPHTAGYHLTWRMGERRWHTPLSTADLMAAARHRFWGRPQRDLLEYRARPLDRSVIVTVRPPRPTCWRSRTYSKRPRLGTTSFAPNCGPRRCGTRPSSSTSTARPCRRILPASAGPARSASGCAGSSRRLACRPPFHAQVPPRTRRLGAAARADHGRLQGHQHEPDARRCTRD